MTDPFLDAAVARGGDLALRLGCPADREELGRRRRPAACACTGACLARERMPVRLGLLTILRADLVAVANRRMAETRAGR